MYWIASSAIAVCMFQPGLSWNGKIGVVLRNRFGCHWLASPPTKPQKYSKPMPFGHCRKRPGLAVREERRVVILAEPRGRVAVVPQDRADRALLDRDDRVVAGEAGRDLADHAEAHRVVVAPGDQRRARRRAERRRMEVGVAQAAPGDAVERRGRDHAAEGAGRAEAVVIGHDQQHVGRLLRRHHAGRPPRGGLRGSFLDHAAELRIGRRQLLAADGRGGAGGAEHAGDLLCRSKAREAEGCNTRHGQYKQLSFHCLLQWPNFVRLKKFLQAFYRFPRVFSLC